MAFICSRTTSLNRALAALEAHLPDLYVKAYREFVYFLLNFVAFYGYLMGILAFYYPDDDKQPSYVRSLKFGYGNRLADWTGNFAGDLMWTIEPLVILGSPMVMSFKPSLLDDDDDDGEPTNSSSSKPKAD